MDALAQQSASFSQDGENAAAAMHKLLGLSSAMEQAVSAASLRSFCELAKVDHLIYKFRVYKVLLGLTSDSPGDFASHMDCRLGKWYFQGEGKSCFSRLPGYREVEEPHRQVHDQALAALHSHAEGRGSDMLRAVSVMESASLSVLNALEQMARSGELHADTICQQ